MFPESITDYLGAKDVKFMMLLQVETKQDKLENKVLVGIIVGVVM